MIPDDQFSSLEPSKRLKELGVPQKSLWDWVDSLGTPEVDLSDETPYSKICSAFTVAELGEMLSDHLNEYNYVFTFRGKWIISYSYMEFVADTEADARAKMLIHLIEEGVLKPCNLKTMQI